MANLGNLTSGVKVLGLAATTLVTTTSGQVKFIGKATFTNTSSNAVQIRVWILPTGTTQTSGSGGNWIIEKVIQPGRTFICEEIQGHVLGNTFTLSALADTASVINAVVSGTTEV